VLKCVVEFFVFLFEFLIVFVIFEEDLLYVLK